MDCYWPNAPLVALGSISAVGDATIYGDAIVLDAADAPLGGVESQLGQVRRMDRVRDRPRRLE
jgi:hypothetical protein